MNENTEVLNANASYFFIPFCFDTEIREYASKVVQDSGWDQCSAKDVKTDYLLSYACRLTQNPDTYIRFKRNDLEKHSFYLCQNFTDKDKKERFTDSTILFSEIAVSLFGTGIGFLEVNIEYHDLDYDNICDFIYQFKKTDKADKYKHKYDCISLLQFIEQTLPSETKPFFYVTCDYKKECLGYHFFRNEAFPDQQDHLMYCLGRGYQTRFTEGSDDSSCDMLYHSSSDACWSGSQEGLANFTIVTEGNKSFTMTLKPKQLRNDYRFMYLLLLNQRFAALRYIEMISEKDYAPSKQMNAKGSKKLTSKIEEFKSIYSYRIISNDRVYQNVYKRMYDLLGIDLLIEDMNDYLEQIRTSYSENAELGNARLNKAVFILSILTVFSGLVDLAGYLEKFDLTQSVSRIISLVCVGFILIIMIWRYRKK